MEKLIDIIKNSLASRALSALDCCDWEMYSFEVDSQQFLPKGIKESLGERRVFSAHSGYGVHDKHAFYSVNTGKYKYVYFLDYMFEEAIIVFIKKNDYKKFRKDYRAAYLKENPKARKYDIVIPETLRQTLLHHTVEFYRIVQKFEQYNLSRNKGILLYGPPGNGKTSLLKWISNKMEEEGARVYNIKNPMDDLKGKEKGVLLFDDINVELFNRATSPEAAKFLLTYLDGIHSKSSQIRVFSTNEHIDQIEEAFLRPGRIDVAIEIGNPNDDSRAEYYHSITNDVRQHFTLEQWMATTEEMSFAQMANIYSNALACVLIDNKKPELNEIIRNIKDLMNLKVGGKKRKIGLV